MALPTAPIKVDKISLVGPGVVILTGPSSCGKGEVAAALCRTLSIDQNHHLSMGDILRETYHKAKIDQGYAQLLAEKYNISQANNIFDCVDTTPDLIEKVRNYTSEMEAFFQRAGMATFTSQLEWLEFCTTRGLLVPNRWTHNFIAAHIEHNLDFQEHPFILDGYPRTVIAAEKLVSFLRSIDIPIIKVLHLSISKQEMIYRAQHRGRVDDDQDALLRRYNFYVENVQPSVDYLKKALGSEYIALIDAHQPIYDCSEGQRHFNLEKSIAMVAAEALRSIGVPRQIIQNLLDLPASSSVPITGLPHS
ncbi:MAG: nucleoside monophosphate kinase [Anaerolineae bacterium]|nr:nucleoside monophosphate kinase [Anaerolineae bacterium]